MLKSHYYAAAQLAYATASNVELERKFSSYLKTCQKAVESVINS